MKTIVPVLELGSFYSAKECRVLSVLQVQLGPNCGVSKGQKFEISPERLHSVLCGNQIGSSPKAAPPFEGSHSSRCLV